MGLSGLFRIALSLVACSAAVALGQNSAMDLRQVLQSAESENPDLRAIRQQRALALAGLQTARQFPNPTFSFGAARDTPHESVIFDQPFEVGGQRGKRIAVAQEEQKGTELEIAALARQVRRRTREGFFRVLFSRAETEQARSALDVATRLLQVVQQRFDAGDVAQLEVIQADVELARANVEYEAALQGEKGADAQLAALIGRRLDQRLAIDGKLEAFSRPESLESVTEAAMRSNSDLQRIAQEVEIEQRRLTLVKAQRIPNVDVQFGTDLNSPPDFRAGPRGQIALTLPLFYRGQGEVALSTAKLAFLRLVLQAQRTSASVQVAVAYFDYLAKARQADAYAQKVVPQTVRLQQMAEESYRAGKSNLLVVIDAQRKLTETRKTYLENLFAVQSSFAILEEAVGSPLD